MYKVIAVLMLVGCAHQRLMPAPGVEPAPVHPITPFELDHDRLDDPGTDTDDGMVAHDAHPGAGGTIKTWSSGETLTASELNANFAHIHNNMVGAHGGRLVDSDVSSIANINSSKLAAYRYIPTNWEVRTLMCAVNGACTVAASQNITSDTRTAQGVYSVVMPAHTDNAYAVFLTVNACNAGNCTCQVNGQTTTTITVNCFRVDTGSNAAVDATYSLTVMDNN